MFSQVQILIILLVVLLAVALYAAARGLIAARREKGRGAGDRGREPAGTIDSGISDGREIQKKFLPLDFDKDGNKLRYGYRETKKAAFFGYYAEVREISGDYFDYYELDGRYYAIIKCDIAGKGIPAALIMIQVATIFRSSFRHWDMSDADERLIENVVYQINDFIETLNFQGCSAAFTLCLFDTETGTLHLCNAGDNIVHVFDSAERRVQSITLPETPAAGLQPSSEVAAKSGYPVHTMKLNHGDILLLYTDGIEGAPLAAPKGRDRVHEIVNAVMNRTTFSLQDLFFNFSGDRQDVEEVVMALIAAEKMFRCHYDPHVQSGEWAQVDTKTDNFLKAYFLHYDKYCANTREDPYNKSYMYYTDLKEDEQRDALAILAIKRK